MGLAKLSLPLGNGVTVAQQILNLNPENRKPLNNQALSESDPKDSAFCLALSCADDGLALVVKAWPSLPLTVRAAILTLVKEQG